MSILSVALAPLPVTPPPSPPAASSPTRTPTPAHPPRRTTEHRYGRGHRPLGIRAANHAARLLAPVKPALLSLDPEVLLREAEESLQLDDFGSTEFLEPLHVFTRSLDHEANLLPIGRFFARGQILASLRNRLLVEHTRATDPAASRPLAPITFIVGLPRTGSTFLQLLLSQDLDHRMLLTWEAAQPVVEPGRRDVREQELAKRMKLLDYLAPNARTLHPIGADLPTECVALLANSFASLELATINWVPSYLEWCFRQRFDAHYRYFERQLQVLQAQRPATRWLLKSPSHLFWLDDLLQVFPDARIVQTHRDPLSVIGSFCSLSSTFCQVGSDAVPHETIARRWTEAWADGLVRTELARNAHPELSIADVRYDELVASPLDVVTQLYADLDLELTAATRRRMEDFLAQPEGTSGCVHRYSLEQFGLDVDEERARYGWYRAAYGV